MAKTYKILPKWKFFAQSGHTDLYLMYHWWMKTSDESPYQQLLHQFNGLLFILLTSVTKRKNESSPIFAKVAQFSPKLPKKEPNQLFW